MRAILALLAFIAFAEPEWRTAPEADVLLHPFSYEPVVIRLAAGRPVKLHFVNNGAIRLSFSAPEFFAAAQIRRRDAVANGRFELAPSEERVIALVPAAGHYRARSANSFHRLRGMRAEIIVE